MTTTRAEPPTHPLHTYIAGLIAEQVKSRHVVVIYDPREELRPFFAELSGNAPAGVLIPVAFGSRPAKLCVFDGSFLEVRMAVEPVTTARSQRTSSSTCRVANGTKQGHS
jgi:hypothetical protein